MVPENLENSFYSTYDNSVNFVVKGIGFFIVLLGWKAIFITYNLREKLFVEKIKFRILIYN